MTQDPGNKGKHRRKKKRAQKDSAGESSQNSAVDCGWLSPQTRVCQEEGLWKVPELRQAEESRAHCETVDLTQRDGVPREDTAGGGCVQTPDSPPEPTRLTLGSWTSSLQNCEKLPLFSHSVYSIFVLAVEQIRQELCSRLRVPVHTENGTDGSVLASPESSSVLDTLQDTQLELMINSGPEA